MAPCSEDVMYTKLQLLEIPTDDKIDKDSESTSVLAQWAALNFQTLFHLGHSLLFSVLVIYVKSIVFCQSVVMLPPLDI